MIAEAKPDVAALQELDSVTGRMAGRFIPGELGEMTGMHARFCRAIDYDGGAYGVGLLSRDEPLAVRRIPLPGREESRVLFVAEFPDYVVCVTHLSLTPEDQRASLPIIRTVTDTCRKPVLLAGDFNMDDAEEVLGGLGGEFRPLSDTAQLTFQRHADTKHQRIENIRADTRPGDIERHKSEKSRNASGDEEGDDHQTPFQSSPHRQRFFRLGGRRSRRGRRLARRRRRLGRTRRAKQCRLRRFGRA